MMRLHQHLQTLAVGGHITAKSPFLAQNFLEQPVIDVGGNAINLVVGGHDAANVRLLDCSLKGHQKILANDALGIISRRGVGTSLGLPMDCEVFHGRQNVMAIDIERIALQSCDCRDSHSRYQERILAIGLFGASPARITREIKHRREDLARAARTGLVTRGGEYLLHELRVPGARQPDGLRKTGAAVFHEAMQGLAHKQRRNSEATLLFEETLDSVAQNRRLPRCHIQIRVPPSLKHGPSGLSGERACRIDDFHLAASTAGDLLDFFFEGHARPQVGYSVVNGEAGVAVFGSAFLSFLLAQCWDG